MLPEPVSAEHTAVDVEAPYEHRQGHLAEICRKLLVDRERKPLVPQE